MCTPLSLCTLHIVIATDWFLDYNTHHIIHCLKRQYSFYSVYRAILTRPVILAPSIYLCLCYGSVLWVRNKRLNGAATPAAGYYRQRVLTHHGSQWNTVVVRPSRATCAAAKECQSTVATMTMLSNLLMPFISPASISTCRLNVP